MMSVYNNWQLKWDAARILWVAICRQDTAINTINNEVLTELEHILDEVATTLECKGLIIYSTKAKGFIAGADIAQFGKLDDAQLALNFLHQGQRVFNKLAALNIPTVAMIAGFCMGGGLELALACRYRVAADTDDTKFALPEILLGIHPGWGGSVRLVQLIGGVNALTQVILRGASLWPATAAKLGIVDAVVPLRQLRTAAVYMVTEQPKRHTATLWQRLSNYPGIRHLLAKLIQAQLAKRVNIAHYPAPYAVVANWQQDGARSANSQALEAASIVRLLTQNDTAKNLVRAFLLKERLKSFAKPSQFHATCVHVIGAGVMGGDIAAWCALQGLTVTLQDKDYSYIAKAMARAYQLYKKRLRKPYLLQAAMDRLIPDVNGAGIAKADVIIEAIFEDLTAKQHVFITLEKNALAHALLATNTSSIPLEDIASVLVNPQRLVGMHFFNPVAKMELIEVVQSRHNTAAIIADACAFVAQIGRLPLPVNSSPGFLINRVLMAYLMECIILLDEGMPGEAIDAAALEFGMMMGPIELADTVGLDVCLAVANNLTHHFGGQIPERLQQKVAHGELGKKTTQGFYSYKNGKKITAKVMPANSAGQDIAHRLLLRMLNEAAACVREGVVADSDLLDAGMIFGTGFAPFRGGPLHYAHHLGYSKLCEMSQQLKQRYGERFSIDESFNVK